MIYTIETEFKAGDKVNVLNYRKKSQVYEPGEVKFVRTTLFPDGTFYLYYEVVLDRKVRTGKKNPWGTIRLTVSDDQLKPLT